MNVYRKFHPSSTSGVMTTRLFPSSTLGRSVVGTKTAPRLGVCAAATDAPAMSAMTSGATTCRTATSLSCSRGEPRAPVTPSPARSGAGRLPGAARSHTAGRLRARRRTAGTVHARDAPPPVGQDRSGSDTSPGSRRSVAGSVRIGVSGWSYDAWRGRFYPETLARRRQLEYLARRMTTAEINGSFYSLQRPTSFRRWYEETPEGFIFAVKGSRFITHMKKLRDVERPLANFFASGVLRLAEKLGPILWQFPAHLAYDEERFARFLELLPRNTEQAAALARHHDARLRGRSWTRAEVRRPLRYAFEVRHPSFFDDAFVRLL